MWSISLAVVATTLTLSTSIQANPIPPEKHCLPTLNWPGWAGIKHAFIFGDSYTQTGYNQTLIQPTPTNPLGNPTYPGYTSSNGPNWVDYLTVKYNSSLLLTYNLAYGGATMDATLVAPYEPTVSSIVDQITYEWFPTYSPAPPEASWSPRNTLFAVFDGINDVGNSWWENTTALNAEIFSVYSGLVYDLYAAGARNFAFLNVPPVDRAPLSLVNSAADQALEKEDIAAWNAELISMATSIKRNKTDVNIFTVDANSLFTDVLNNPKSFAQTAGYQNTTGYCVDYENGTPAPNTLIADCGIPVNEYFWLNTLHPTYPMHDVLAQGVARVLEAGPNIC